MCVCVCEFLSLSLYVCLFVCMYVCGSMCLLVGPPSLNACVRGIVHADVLSISLYVCMCVWVCVCVCVRVLRSHPLTYFAAYSKNHLEGHLSNATNYLIRTQSL